MLPSLTTANPPQATEPSPGSGWGQPGLGTPARSSDWRSGGRPPPPGVARYRLWKGSAMSGDESAPQPLPSSSQLVAASLAEPSTGQPGSDRPSRSIA